MRKIFILLGLMVVTTSCTYEDVVNFLSGNENNLTEAEKKQVTEAQQSNIEVDLDKDRGVTPPNH